MGEGDSLELAKKLASQLGNDTPTILYLGTRGMESTEIASWPWSLVVTSMQDDSLARVFTIADKRRVIILRSLHQMLEDARLNRRELDLVYLWGDDNPQDLSRPAKRMLERNAAEKLAMFPEMLEGNFGNLVIDGYDPLDPCEISIGVLYETLSKMRQGSVYMFGAGDSLWQDEECAEYIAQLINDGILVVAPDPLGPLLSTIADETEDYEYIGEDNGAIIYINENRIKIADDKLFETRGFVELLSEQTFAGSRIPDYLRSEYFYSFLRSSARAPYWIGYENNFNLKRDFENDLEESIREALQPKKGVTVKPILLEGQTCSGKSMALGQIAWSVFRKHEFPVLFIRNPEIRLDNPVNFGALDRLLQDLEKRGAKKILLIWDNSQSFDQRREALKLNINLQNRGRKTVLLCSSYVGNCANAQKSNVDREFRIVRTEINLRPKEMFRLKSKILEYGEVPEKDFDLWVAQKDASHLLALLYNLLRPHLGETIMVGVEKETNIGMEHFMGQVESLEKSAEKPMTEMAGALKAVGLEMSDLSNKCENSGRSSDPREIFRRFFTTIAFCSQFQINLPLFTALRLLDLKWDNKFYRILAALENVSCLKIQSEDLEDNSDRWISFRTPLEAKLYLESMQIPLEEEIKCVANLVLNITGSRHYGQKDEITAIEKLIRVIGPNSHEDNVTRKYGPYYTQILDALTTVRKCQKVNDLRLINQEITWLREIYRLKSPINPDCQIQTRIEKLREGSQLAQKTISQNRNCRDSLVGELSSLIVEYALCELHLQMALDEDKDLDMPSSLNFRELFLKLKDVIADNPSDIYARNALLRVFLTGYYERPETDSLERTRYLGEILSVVDLVESWVGQSYDDEEYKLHCHELMGKVSDKAQEEYASALINQGDGSGLYLKVRSHLASKGIDLNRHLEENDRKDIKDIMNYMDKYRNLTLNHAGALYMRLRLAWLLYNGRPPFSGEERQRTYMTSEQWREITELCAAYEQRFLNSNDLPINASTILYLYALASAQLRNYGKSHEIFHKLGLRSMSYFSNVRNRIWHILCDSKGMPLHFEGLLELGYYKEDKSSGYIKIPAVDRYKGVYFFGPSLKISLFSGHFNDLEIGVGYRGFEAFRLLEEE